MNFFRLGKGSLPALALLSNKCTRSFPSAALTSPLQDEGASGHPGLLGPQDKLASSPLAITGVASDWKNCSPSEKLVHFSL